MSFDPSLRGGADEPLALLAARSPERQLERGAPDCPIPWLHRRALGCRFTA
jgi:hypothetical protein